MDNNFENTPKEDNTPGAPVNLSKKPDGEGQNADSNTTQAGSDAGQQYTDPNAGRQYTDPNAGQQPYGGQQYQYGNQNDQSAYNYNQQQYYNQQNQANSSNSYNYGQQNGYDQQNNYQPNHYNYQDNYSYNTGNYNSYGQGQDTSPMSMGDWILTLLAAMVPCFGIIIYFVWAFSKTTNINRRNFCRAQLIIMGIVLAVYLIFVVLFGTMIFGAVGSGAFY